MSVTQREMDIAELESQLRIGRLLDEWRRGFLGSRIPVEQITPESLDEPAAQEITGDDSVLGRR